MKRTLLAKRILLVLVVFVGTAQAAVNNLTQVTSHVTIQDAIDNAVNGDVLEADPNTYVEAINFNGLAITLRSASGDPADTIIDGNGAFHVVQCVSGEDPNTILQGFTITGGNANGGGLDSSGGGMLNLNSSNPTVTNCIFFGNSANSDGGGIYNFNSSPTVTNCTFSGNSSNDEGGGIHNRASSPMVTNCTFFGNSANSNGGGIFNSNSSPTVTNGIFWNNSDIGGMDASAQIHVIAGTPTVNYSNVMGGWTGLGTNNINTDPLFIDADGADNIVGTADDDFRLQANSPCIDAADSAPLTAQSISTDLSDNPRFVNATTIPDTGAGMPSYLDMGAYEVQSDCPLVGDLNCDGIVDLFDLALMAANWLATI